MLQIFPGFPYETDTTCFTVASMQCLSLHCVLSEKRAKHKSKVNLLLDIHPKSWDMLLRETFLWHMTGRAHHYSTEN